MTNNTHNAIARDAIIAMIDNAIDEMHDRARDDISIAYATHADSITNAAIALHDTIAASIPAPLTPDDALDLIDLIDDPALPACCAASLAMIDALHDPRLA